MSIDIQDLREEYLRRRRQNTQLESRSLHETNKNRIGKAFLHNAKINVQDLRDAITHFKQGKIDETRFVMQALTIIDGFFAETDELGQAFEKNHMHHTVSDLSNALSDNDVALDTWSTEKLETEINRLTLRNDTLEAQFADEVGKNMAIRAFLHNVRVPITVVHGNTELFYDERLSKSSLIEVIIPTAETFSAELNILNKYLEHEEFERADFSPRETINTFVKSFRSQNNAILDARIELLAPRYFNGVEDVILSALGNFARNSDDLGAKRITINMTWDDEANELTFSVSDDGPGFDPAKREKLFHLGTQLEGLEGKKKRGEGRGLSTIADNVSAIGGKCGCYSAGFGEGATFWIAIPVTALPASKPPHTPTREFP